MTTSLVHEMQRLAMDPRASVADVVRAALVVADKLNVDDLRTWCKAELNGYAVDGIPKYRVVTGELKAWNPVLRGYIPVVSSDNPSLMDSLSTREINQPIGELERLHQSHAKDGNVLQVPLPSDLVNTVFGNSELFRLGMRPTLIVGASQLFAILESVRNSVLQWSLQLERSGIIGEGMTFTKEEKKHASQVTYNIATFTGVLGNVEADSVHIGDYASIHNQLKGLGVSQQDRNELETILDELPKATADSRESWLKRGREWLDKNAPLIGTLSSTIKNWIEIYRAG